MMMMMMMMMMKMMMMKMMMMMKKKKKKNDDDNNNKIIIIIIIKITKIIINQFVRRDSRFLTIPSLCRKLSPTRTLKWPGRSSVQITCNR